MARIHGNGKIPLDDLRLLVERISDNMRAFAESLDGQSGETRLPNLRAVVDRIGSAFPRRPPYDARYTAQWSEFVSGKRRDLDRGAMRYFCWEPDIATSNRFLRYVQGTGMELTTRPLAGMIRSCHSKWEAPFPASPSAGMIKDLVERYEGPSPVILKWKSNLDAVLGPKGPELLGRSLIGGNKTLRAFIEEWYLDPRSPFVMEVVEAATAICRSRFARPSRAMVELLFGELLSWSGWKLPRLKQEIAVFILDAATGQAREILQKFVLIHKDFGDPRLPANETKWAGIPHEAKTRVVRWLSKNPFSLLEHVYLEGTGWTWQRPGEGGQSFNGRPAYAFIRPAGKGFQ